MSEKENMLAGLFYKSDDPELIAARQTARRLLCQYNATDPAEAEKRSQLLSQLLADPGKQCIIEPPFYCDYGSQIHLQDNVFINFNCIILDCARVDIGAGTILGPNVQIYTVTHPVDPAARTNGQEFAAPISIGSNVWIGGGAIILPGVKIGNGAVIGAGSVVTKEVAPNTVVAGNPARLIRQFYEFQKTSTK